MRDECNERVNIERLYREKAIFPRLGGDRFRRAVIGRNCPHAMTNILQAAFPAEGAGLHLQTAHLV